MLSPSSSQHTEEAQSEAPTEVLKLQLILLLNEINFQAYMRYRHLQYIRRLKKDRMQEELKEADRHAVVRKHRARELLSRYR